MLIILGVLAVVAGLWLWFSRPDQKVLDDQQKSAMPYDSMYVDERNKGRR